MRGIRGRPAVVLAALALVLALAPTASRATGAGAAGLEGERLNRLLRYAGCAVGIATAGTGLGISIAVFNCAVLIYDEF